jgi:hypothetical protein
MEIFNFADREFALPAPTWLVYSFRLPAALLVVTAIGFSPEQLLSGASIRT